MESLARARYELDPFGDDFLRLVEHVVNPRHGMIGLPRVDVALELQRHLYIEERSARGIALFPKDAHPVGLASVRVVHVPLGRRR